MSDELDREYDRRLGTWSDIRGHLEYIHDVVVEEDAFDVVELGARSGNSTVALLHAVEMTAGRLWSVDIAQPDWPDCVWTSERLTFIQGDDLDVAGRLPMSIDVLFIDTSHHYQQTLDELWLYGERAKVILLHDTDLRRPHAQPKRDPDFPVRAAIGVYCADSNRTVEYRSGSFGMGTVR